MIRPAITIGPDATVAGAATIMYDRRMTRLPVVDVAARLLGIISRADVLAAAKRAGRPRSGRRIAQCPGRRRP